MAQNEVQIIKNNVVSAEKGNVVLPDFSGMNLGDEPRRLRIKVTKGKKETGETFNKITGYCILDIYEGVEDEAKYVRTGVKRISVHFRKVAFKGSANVHSPEDLVSGYLYVKAKGLRLPSVYKLRYEKDKDGNILYDANGEAIIKYPEIWVESDVLGLQEFVTTQDALDVDKYADAVEVKYDEETGEVVDESEAVSDLENEASEDEETNL